MTRVERHLYIVIAAFRFRFFTARHVLCVLPVVVRSFVREPTVHCSQLDEKNATMGERVSSVLRGKMASRSNLHEDLTSAFIRHREGRYDAALDSKNL